MPALRGRLRRRTFWWQAAALVAGYALAFAALEALFGRGATWLLHPPLLWLALSLGARRYHDLGRSAWWLLMLAVPLLGPLVVGFELLLRRGRRGDNRFGADPRVHAGDYHAVR